MIFKILLISIVLFFILYSHVNTFLILLFCILISGLMIFIRYSHHHEHSAFLSIDHYAHKSKLSHWNSELKILLVVVCIFACTSDSHFLISLFLFFSMSILIIVIGKTPLFYYLTLLTVPVLFILLSCLALLVEFSTNPFGVLSFPIGKYFICVSEINQLIALKTILRSVGAISCLYMLSLSTPISRIISVFRKVKIPTIVIDLMYLIYRYLFILLEVHQNMVYAANSRLGYQNYRKSITTMLSNARNLMFISFRKTSDMLSAMESRCYNGEIRFLHKSFPIIKNQILWSTIIIGGVIFLWILTKGMR